MLHRLLRNLSLALAALAMAALALPWTATAGADAAQVTVVSPGGAQQTLSLAALAGSEDVRDRPYALRSGSGESTRVVTGFSLARILDAAGADPYSFSFLEVRRPAGGAVLLSRDQALDGSGDGPSVVYAGDTGTGFLRPSAGAEDANAADSFSAPQGIAIVLRKGAHLKVRATASPRRTEAGQKVEFSALVEQSGAGEQLAYSWYFDDGSSAAGANVGHSFAERGSYDVVVGITSDGNQTGASAVVTVQVGAPLKGPDRKGGGTNHAANAPDHGVAEGPSSGEPGSPAASSLEGRVGRAPDTQRGPRPRVRRGTTDSATTRTAQNTLSGELVEGELVSAETSLPPKQEAARSGKLDGGGGEGGGVPDAAWGILATLGLLGLGAAAEAGGVGGIRFWRGGIS